MQDPSEITLKLHMADTPELLVQRAEISPGKLTDLRCREGRITECARALRPIPREFVIDAKGCALIPGLHDHHIHLFALAAQVSSVQCGPPQVSSHEQLTKTIRSCKGNGWIRGVAYHESIAGNLNRRTIDAMEKDRPVRIQHRSGRVWWLNTRGLIELGMNPRGEGELYRMDERVRKGKRLDQSMKNDLKDVISQLVAMGITGVSDATPSNEASTVDLMREIADGQMRINAMGNERLNQGHLKLLIDDYRLPSIDSFERKISRAHKLGRPVAIHCVSRVELVFALSALQRVGVVRGDRLEHASVVDDDTLDMIRNLELTVVTQPSLIFERGDQYAKDLQSSQLRSLYRVGGLIDKGIPVGASSDAPFGSPDPWMAMRAAVERKTRSGLVLNSEECINVDDALSLFTSPQDEPGGPSRTLGVGCQADMVLLSRPREEALRSLCKDDVWMTIVDGRVVYDRTGAMSK